MKNITLSADEKLIEAARERARREKTTLNARFREWLSQYAGTMSTTISYDALMTKLSYAQPRSKLTREEMNER